MSFERTLLSIAMESGEVYVEPEIGLPDEDEELSDYNELVVSTGDEISRGIATVEALESLAKKYEAAEVTQESLESYRADVMQVFKLTGVSAPVSMIVPSFEDIKEDKTGIGARVKDMGAKVWAWIQEQIAKLKKRFKIMSLKIRARIALAKRKGAQLKEKAKDLHDAEVSGGALPGWMIVDGKLSVEKVRSFVQTFKSGPAANIMRGLDPQGNVISKEAREKYVESGAWHSVFDSLMKSFEAQKVSEYHTSAEDLVKAEELVFSALEDIRSHGEDATSARKMMEDIQTQSLKNHPEGPATEQVTKARKETEVIIKLQTAIGHFTLGMLIPMTTIHANLSSIRKVAEGNSDK